MQKNLTLSKSDIDRIIEMAWEDRTTFDAIESQYGLKEQKVKELMRENLKNSSYRCRKTCVESTGNSYISFIRTTFICRIETNPAKFINI